MKVYDGKSVFKGVAAGKILVYARDDMNVRRLSAPDSDAELMRFRNARDIAKNQLGVLYRMALDEVGSENAAIFEIHLMMLDDFSFIDAIESLIVRQHCNAEYAVSSTGHSFYDMFLNMDNKYLQSRSDDVRDVTERLLTILSGSSETVIGCDESVIIIAKDLSPSETIRLDRRNVLAFATANGSENSHMAILARSMGIPAVVGTGIAADSSLNGHTAIVDGYTGHIYIDPDEMLVRETEKKHRQELRKRELLNSYIGRDNVTLDGRKIGICANIGGLEDIDDALRNDAGGIGLFRSEFIYLSSQKMPTEDELTHIYRTAAEKMHGREIVIRTLDIGSDKIPDYIDLPYEENPALGCRGIRFCIRHPDIFKTQLRAIYRASVFGNISVMYPMIVGPVDFGRALKASEQVRKELSDEGIQFRNIRQGAMIETPAAAIVSDILAQQADFFSIGTNDLSQYAMAVDRGNTNMAEFFDPMHIALFRMIKMTVDNAHRFGKKVGICGEMGADSSLTQIFLTMGVDEISVVPTEILSIRKKVCETDIGKISYETIGQLW